MMSLCTPANCGCEKRGFSKRPIIARMRKARAFSTPGLIVCGGGGAALLLKKEAMVLVLVLQAVLLAPAANRSVLLSVLCCFRALVALEKQRSASRALTLLCSSALQQAVSALHALLADQALWQA